MSEHVPEENWEEPDWSATGRELAESGKLQHTPDLTKMMRRLRVLIVGGGAIGPVFGYHLKLGGAHVAMFVKPKYAAEAEDGCALHPYGVAGKRPKRHFQPDVVISDQAELREHTFDQVWLCVASPALRGGTIERLYQSCITAAIWVHFTPGHEERQFLTQTIPQERLVSGVVNFIAYQAPLPGEDLWPEGVAYFVPPWSMAPFSAADDLYASAVANALQRGTGSLVGSVVPDTAIVAGAANAVVLPFVIAMESLNWSLSALRGNQAVIELMRTAMVDLQNAILNKSGKLPGKWAIVQKPWFWKAALFAAPYATAFPLEGYLRHHFTKVREETDQLVDGLVTLCRDAGVEPRALEALREQWRSRRGKIGTLDPEEYDTQSGRRLGVATPVPSGLPAEDVAATSVEFRVIPQGLDEDTDPGAEVIATPSGSVPAEHAPDEVAATSLHTVEPRGSEADEDDEDVAATRLQSRIDLEDLDVGGEDVAETHLQSVHELIGEVDDVAATSFEPAVDLERFRQEQGVEGSQSLQIGAEISEEFEGQDTPPPTVAMRAPPLPAAPKNPVIVTNDDNEPRQREATPMSAVIPVVGREDSGAERAGEPEQLQTPIEPDDAPDSPPQLDQSASAIELDTVDEEPAPPPQPEPESTPDPEPPAPVQRASRTQKDTVSDLKAKLKAMRRPKITQSAVVKPIDEEE